MVLNNITYYLIFGKPLIMWLGIITLSLFVAAAYIGWNLHKGKPWFKWKIAIAVAAFIWAAIHATLGILAYY